MTLYYNIDSRFKWYDERLQSILKWTDDAPYIYEVYRASMKRAKELGHTIHLYGDGFAGLALEGYWDEYTSIDHKRFKLLDEVKIYVHEQNDLDCVTFDGDIILNSRLQIPEYNDVWFEYEETKKGIPWSDKVAFNYQIGNVYEEVLNVFKDCNTRRKFPYFNYDLEKAFNVGIIKFNSDKAKELLIKGFYDLKDFYLSQIESKFNLRQIGMLPSLMICQYNFFLLSEKNKLKVGYTQNFTSSSGSNDYIHYIGPTKYMDKCRAEVTKILL